MHLYERLGSLLVAAVLLVAGAVRLAATDGGAGWIMLGAGLIFLGAWLAGEIAAVHDRNHHRRLPPTPDRKDAA